MPRRAVRLIRGPTTGRKGGGASVAARMVAPLESFEDGILAVLHKPG